MKGPEYFQALSASSRHGDLMALTPQKYFHRLEEILIIVDKQNPFHR
jgi:hypothetical protein